MTNNGCGPAYFAALQSFCDNHNIIETTGKELSEKTGYAPLRCVRILKELGWLRTRQSSNHAATFTRKGAGKMFRKCYNYYLILRRFEEHYEKVKQ